MSLDKPYVVVGTMYCNEGDYIESGRMLARQLGVNIEQHVITNKPEKEAHNELWASFRTAKSRANMFVKLDADTVLAHDEVLLELWKLMSSNPRITGIQSPLLDYFTDANINGLNCFSPKITFLDSIDPLFCDRRVDVDHDIVIGSDNVPNTLRPAGYHCHHTHDAQSFHFGLHRALKNQTRVINMTTLAWRKHRDRQRALALMGARCATLFRNGGFNYTDELFMQVLSSTLLKYDELLYDL